jgi:hypothetical protein
MGRDNQQKSESKKLPAPYDRKKRQIVDSDLDMVSDDDIVSSSPFAKPEPNEEEEEDKKKRTPKRHLRKFTKADSEVVSNPEMVKDEIGYEDTDKEENKKPKARKIGDESVQKTGEDDKEEDKDNEKDEEKEEETISKEVFHDQMREGWICSHKSADIISKQWVIEGVLCENAELMSQLLYNSMGGVVKLHSSLMQQIRYTAFPEGSSNNKSLQTFVKNPWNNYDTIRTRTHVVISIKVNNEWKEWVKVAKKNGFYHVYACRDFKIGEVVSIFFGTVIWISKKAYVDCNVAKTLSKEVGSDCPVAYCRGRDAMVQKMDSKNCSLMLGAACIQHSTDDNLANLLLNDDSAMYASQDINKGDELLYQYS